MSPYELSRTCLLIMTTAMFVSACFAIWHTQLADYTRRRDLRRAAETIIARTHGTCAAIRAIGIPADLWYIVILYRGQGGEIHLRMGGLRHPGTRTEVITAFAADLVSQSPYLKACTLISTHCHHVASEMTRSAQITGVHA